MEQSSSEKSDNGRLIDEALAATESDANPLDGKDAAHAWSRTGCWRRWPAANLEHLEHAA